MDKLPCYITLIVIINIIVHVGRVVMRWIDEKSKGLR